MLPAVLLVPLLLGSTAHGRLSRAASRDVTAFLQPAQEDPWESLNVGSASCENRKNRTWITLQLTNSSLTAFPVCLPEALEVLDLSNNLLEEVNGTEIAKLPRLRVLSLRHNHLSSVRWGSEALSSLLKLDLSFNQLSSVPSCQGSALPNLSWLSLAGNPLIEIQPLAFSCYPQLQVLNLSATLLGWNGSRGIGDSAFAISTDPDELSNGPGNSISVLDLSGTFLEKIQPEWARDLASLRSLHLANMPRLRSLDSDFFRSLPALRELHCQGSPSLGFVQTEVLDSAPHLSHLSFENCNLSSFQPWNTSSSLGISISLRGNPLLCGCQLSWLLARPEEILLQGAQETFCTSQEDLSRPPTSFSLLELYHQCQSEGSVTLPGSNTALPHREASSSTRDGSSAVEMTESALLGEDLTHTSSPVQGDVMSTPTSKPMLTRDIYTSSPVQGDVMSTAASNPTEPILTKANSSSHEEEAVSEPPSNPPSLASVTSFPVFLQELFAQSSGDNSTGPSGAEQLQRGPGTARTTFPQEGPPEQSSSDFSAGTGAPHGSKPDIHSFGSHASPPQASTRSSAHPEPAGTAPPPHYTDDYDYEEQPNETPVQTAHVACDYNPCRHLQRPCRELQNASQCSCPGTSGEDEVPEPPRLREVVEITDSSAQVRWCAPYSVVQSYELTLRARDGDRQFVTDSIYPTARQYTLYNLRPFTTYRVCVAASNTAGSSRTAGRGTPGDPCTSFTTKPSYKFVFAGLSAACGLLLISTVVLSVCLCKACKKPQSEHYGTHLVSYKNPAFDYPLKIQTPN